jgi:thimet oligopeptidase
MNSLEKKLLNMPLDFSGLTVEVIDDYLVQITELYKSTYAQIKLYKNKKNDLSFKTVIQPLINLELYSAKIKSLCTFPRQVFLNEEVREKSNKAAELIIKLDIEADSDPDVYAVFKQYVEEIFPVEKNNQSPEQNRLIDKLNLKYKRNGLYIKDEETKKNIKDLKIKISEKSIKYAENLANDNTILRFTTEELEGLPNSWLNLDREVEPGKFEVTLKYPDVKPILEYAKKRDTRKTVYTAFNRLCADENAILLKEIIVDRQKLAQLLGYDTHADYAIEIRMARTKENVKKFLDSMNERFSFLFDRDLKTLTEFAKQQEKDPNFILHTFDMAYYMRLHAEAVCQVDMDKVKEYFPIKKVIAGVLSIYEEVLGLKFSENNLQSKWHDDVLFYEVYDDSSNQKSIGEKVGSFYLDLYPRIGKFNHAAVFDLVSGGDLSDITNITNDRELAVAAMVCNFPKNENIPFDDVVTFFHEFGHLVHVLCSKTKLPQFFAFNVELDFVEAPSQMLENWCYQELVLKILSEHPLTKQSLPADIVEKIKKRDKLHSGFFYKRQLLLSYFDYFLHATVAEQIADLDIIKFFHELQKKMINIPTIANDSFPSSFAHLIGGYDAGYYSYLMSETYALDMFHTIFKEDPLSKILGERYRQIVLEPGASKDGMDIIQEFLGREPKLDAFLEHCGL